MGVVTTDELFKQPKKVDMAAAKQFLSKLTGKQPRNKNLVRLTKKVLTLEANPRKRPRKYPESDLQRNIIKELGLRYPRIRALTTATGAGGKRSGKMIKGKWVSIEGKRLKAEGLTAGFPDLGIYLPSGIYHGFFAELKAPGKKPDPIQREKIALLQEQGYCVVVIDSMEKFWDALEGYFGIPLEKVA